MKRFKYLIYRGTEDNPIFVGIVEYKQDANLQEGQKITEIVSVSFNNFTKKVNIWTEKFSIYVDY